jgi:hypothetical protein
MLVFPCPSCSAKLQMSEDLAGKKVRCSSCKEVVTAPERSGPSDAIKSGPAQAPTSVAPGKPRTKGGSDRDDDESSRRGSGGDIAAAAGTAAVATAAGGLGIGAILAIVGIGAFCLVGCVVAGLLGLLLPAVQKVREAAARTQTTNNMKQIALACHSHHDTFKTLPTPKAFMPPQGTQPVELSWRVSILPFIEQAALFNQFDRTQAWDSPRNKVNSDSLIVIYQDPGRDQGPTVDTHFQYFTGPNTLWPTNKKCTFVLDIPDGTSNTFLFAEAANPVPWAKPAEMAIAPGQPLPLPEGRFITAMCDGSVRFVDRARINDQGLRLYIDPKDGQAPPPIE